MLDIKFIRENVEAVRKGAEAKNVKLDLELLLTIDDRRRALISETESLQATKNLSSKLIPSLSGSDRDAKILEMKEIDSKADQLKIELEGIEREFTDLMLNVPNLPKPDVIVGKDDSENTVLRTWGEPTKFDFEPREYTELGSELDIIDTERATKTSGARFGFLKGDGALLEIALVNFAISKLIKHGFKLIMPPYMVKEEIMRGMGYMEHGGADEIYHLDKDGLYLIGTSEQVIGGMHKDELLPQEQLPLRYLGYSACFRREAGSYGKDTKGILRVHQFDKLEMFSYTSPEHSDNEHLFILSLEEELMQDLKIPYQVLNICSGDLGDSAARKYDIEAWIPSQQKYRETHSSSTTTDFQSRRLNIKYKNLVTGRNDFVHMLNGTAFAIGRTIIAILENYQQADGTVKVPEALIPFMFGKTEIK
ncbi:MAG: seryl-tRNA synthetase [Candidatus Doudnabacteria bacterium]|nr:seryl-tRNA synthetase [Candidatus Doudnabacteria bacterium]